MSLFPSAFDGIASASSSKPLTAGSSSAGKRKRPSVGGKDDQLRATQVNLAKLMEKVDRGDFKDRSGREAMGQMGEKAKKAHSGDDGPQGKGGKGKGGPRDSFGGKFDKGKGGPRDSFGSKFDKGKGGPRDSFGGKFDKGKGGPRDSSGGKFDKVQNKKQDNKPANKPAPAPAQSPKQKDNKKTAKPAAPKQPTPSGKGKSKLAPAELDIELPTPSSKAVDDGLTDMQRKMQTKLEGARFRWINEQLYSTASGDAVAMMDNDPKVFADYHDTHRQLTAAWPMPPLEHIIALLKPLPKSTVIVDLGCGDAGLARALVPTGKVVLSYDLVGDIGGDRSQGGEGWVVPCDFLSGVPLPGRAGGEEEAEGEQKKKKHGGKRDPAASEIVDAVVCCLSLMGTNWVGGAYEAARILKQGGTFHVAEVTSRFVSTEAFVDAITSFGLVLDSQEEPSTHFTLFKFTKKTATPVGPVRGQDGWDARIEEGEGILRPCVYKRR